MRDWSITHAACKDEYRPFQIMELTADVLKTFFYFFLHPPGNPGKIIHFGGCKIRPEKAKIPIVKCNLRFRVACAMRLHT